MKSHFYHTEIIIDFSNLSFYKNLMSFLGWNIIFEKDNVIGFKSGKNGDIWFKRTLKNEHSNYDNIGVNHLAIRVEQHNDIDEIANFLQKHNIRPLYETPKHRPEFASSNKDTYYQIMF